MSTKLPTVQAIAAALGVSRATIYADAHAGCPLSSVAAARAWRRQHRAPRVRMRRDGPPTLAELLAQDPPARDIDVLDAIDREMVLLPRGLALELVHLLACTVAGIPPQVDPAEMLPRLLPSIPEDLLPGVGRFVE